jgi:hypothetical protein
MFLHHSGQRQHQQRWQTLFDRQRVDHQRSDRQCYVYQTLDRFQQARHAKVFALGQDLQPVKMQIQQETQTCLEQVSAQRQVQANRLMLRLSDFTQRLRQQTAELLSMHSADRALMAEQISQELSELHANLTTAAAALRHTLQQIQQLIEAQAKAEAQAGLQTGQQAQIQQQLQLVQDLANYIATSQAEVKNQLIELSLIRQARSRQVQQMLRSSRDRRLADMAELRTDLQSLHNALHWIVSEDPGASLEAIATSVHPASLDLESPQA